MRNGMGHMEAVWEMHSSGTLVKGIPLEPGFSTEKGVVNMEPEETRTKNLSCWIRRKGSSSPLGKAQPQ